MAKRMDPLLAILSILGYRAIILGSLGGLGTSPYDSGHHGQRHPRSIADSRQKNSVQHFGPFLAAALMPQLELLVSKLDTVP